MSQDSSLDETSSSSGLDAALARQALASRLSEQNFSLGLIAGVVAAIVGAAIWAVITFVTSYQIGWMAVGVGCLVGLAVRVAGRGVEPRFGYLGAALALFGCLLGNFLTMMAFAATEADLSALELVRNVKWSGVPRAMFSTSSPIDLLFYGIAIVEGYKFSFQPENANQPHGQG